MTFDPESTVVEGLPYRLTLIIGRDGHGRPRTRAFTRRTFATEAEALAFREYCATLDACGPSLQQTQDSYLIVHTPPPHAV